jgi:hypothetical protein
VYISYGRSRLTRNTDKYKGRIALCWICYVTAKCRQIATSCSEAEAFLTVWYVIQTGRDTLLVAVITWRTDIIAYDWYISRGTQSESRIRWAEEAGLGAWKAKISGRTGFSNWIEVLRRGTCSYARKVGATLQCTHYICTAIPWHWKYSLDCTRWIRRLNRQSWGP